MHQAGQAAERTLIPPIPRPCSLAPSLTTPLYSISVSKALRQSLRNSFLARVSRTKIHLPQEQAMYACIRRIGGGFFDVVCTPSNATAHSCDPPPSRYPKEPEPRQGGSGPKWIRRCAIVDGALAWGRGKPQPAHCQSTARMPPTHHAVCRTYTLQSIASKCAPRRRSPLS
jgi:hypothetical protein